MLTRMQAEFLDTYFQRLSVRDAASALGIGIGEAETIERSSPVKDIIDAVMPMLLDDIATYGRRIHDLPMQSDQQNSSVIRVHYSVG